tara:strand:+ start:7238 stop:7714 length:477 start_codon:yes stop_codon:yes gene_type:complete
MARSNRKSEESHTTRDEEARADTWLPPSVLEAPPVRDGFRQRWVSTSILGKDQPHHVAKRFREGWTPRPADTVDKSFFVPTIAHGDHAGFIGVEGMILCEMPEERALSRDRYFQKKTGDLNSYVDNNLNRLEASGGVPIDRSESKSTVSRGPARVADD